MLNCTGSTPPAPLGHALVALHMVFMVIAGSDSSASERSERRVRTAFSSPSPSPSSFSSSFTSFAGLGSSSFGSSSSFETRVDRDGFAPFS